MSIRSGLVAVAAVVLAVPMAVALNAPADAASVMDAGLASTTKAPQLVHDTPPTTAIVGTRYSYRFKASGKPAPTFSLVEKGTLPRGLRLNHFSGVLSGTPKKPGSSTFSVTAHNGIKPSAKTDPITIVVSSPEAPAFVDEQPPTTALVGIAYGPYTFTASGTPAPTFVLASRGVLPDGLTLDRRSGVLSGTPTTPGSSTFKVIARNGVKPKAKSDPVTIVVSSPVAPAFTAETPPATATVGDAYGPYTFTASGTPAPTFAVASGDVLPDGLVLDSDTGVLSGTPTTAAATTFTVTATNGIDPDAVSDPITVTVNPRPFTDVPATNPFSSEIDRLAAQGVIKGYPDGTFRPANPVNREAFAAFLSRTLDLNVGADPSGQCSAGQSTFSDIPDNNPFCAAINALATQGILNGYADGTFRPVARISREAIAAFVQRADAYLRSNRTPVPAGSDPSCSTPPFTDVPTTNQFCGDIAFLKTNNISTGYADGTYHPAQTTTRQAVAAFLVRFEDFDATLLSS